MKHLILLAAGFWFSQLVAGAQDFSKLSKDLAADDRDTRREAARELRELGAAALPALPALIGALQDDDEQVAGRAVTAIARIGAKAGDAIPALIETMDPERRRYDEQVVFRAAFALSEIGVAAVGPLREALKSSSARRRMGAAHALQLIGPPAAPAVPELLVALGDDEEQVRGGASAALAAIGEPARSPLLAELKQKPGVAAVNAIGLMGRDASSASQLLRGLAADQASSTELKAAAIEALGQVEPSFDQLRTVLATSLVDGSEEVRRAAASVLLSYPDAERHSLRILKGWLAGEDAELRWRAAWVVGQFGGDAAALAPDLIGLLKKGDDPEEITTALAGLGSGAVGAILETLGEMPVAELQQSDDHWARGILRSAGSLAMPALEAALASDQASTRFAALDALATLGKIARPLVPKFRQATADPVPAVRLAGLVALESAGADPGRLETILQRRCADESADVRAVAVRLLGENQEAGEPSRQLIEKALSDPAPEVRRAAIVALAGFGSAAGSAVPRLVELGQSAGGQELRPILVTLRAIGPAASAALPLVRKSLEAPEADVRGAAIAALVAIEPDGENLTGLLAKMLADKDPAVRHPAIEGLGRRGEDARSVAPQLFALLDDGDDRSLALEALRQIRSRDVDLYVAALKNGEPRVRLFACEALGRLGKDAEKAIPELEKAKKDRYDFVRKRADDAIRRIRG